MKKIVGLLIALALILSFSATVFAAPVSVKTMNNVTIDEEGITFAYKAKTEGVLSITLSGNPGYKVTVSEVKTGDIVGLPESGNAEQTFTFPVKAATSYNIHICGYDKKTWSEATATISFSVTFDDEVAVEQEPVEIEKSDVNLDLGENNVSLLENTIVSLYAFTPAEPGIYTFTVENAEIGSYGFATWSLLEAGENGVLVHTATAAEQTILIGLTATTPTVNVKVEKTGDYTPPVQIQYEEYLPTNSVISGFEAPDDMEEIDITQEQNVVLGDDGYYHLGTADGPVVYVNLNTDQFTLAVLYNAGAPIHMRGIYIDENGDPHYYDFMNMITSVYYNYSQEYDFHPLNTDLMIFLKAYGTSQGWYNMGTSGFESITSGDFEEESAWLAACYIAPNAAPEEPEPSNPNNPTEPSAPATEPSAPATEPSAPATEPSAPATEPSAPETEPSDPATEPVAPGEDDTNDVEDDTNDVEDDNTGVEDDDTNVEDDDTNIEDDDTNVEDDTTDVEDDNNDVEDDTTGAEDDDTDDVPKTGGIGVMGAVIAMAFSAIGGAVVIKKKEF